MDTSQSANRRELKVEFDQLYSVLDYSMHELPAGVLWNPDAATQSQCVELMEGLNRFETVCKELGIQTHRSLRVAVGILNIILTTFRDDVTFPTMPNMSKVEEDHFACLQLTLA